MPQNLSRLVVAHVHIRWHDKVYTLVIELELAPIGQLVVRHVEQLWQLVLPVVFKGVDHKALAYDHQINKLLRERVLPNVAELQP